MNAWSNQIEVVSTKTKSVKATFGFRIIWQILNCFSRQLISAHILNFWSVYTLNCTWWKDCRTSTLQQQHHIMQMWCMYLLGFLNLPPNHGIACKPNSSFCGGDTVWSNGGRCPLEQNSSDKKKPELNYMTHFFSWRFQQNKRQITRILVDIYL